MRMLPSEAKKTLKREQFLYWVGKDGPGRVKTFKAAFSGKASPRMAIKAHCLECCWMDSVAIRECCSPACPLWEYRPYQKRRETNGKSKAKA